MNRYQWLTATFVLLVVVLAAMPSSAEVIADFDEGNGTAIDAYKGSIGGGWTGPWEELRYRLAAEPHTNILVRTVGSANPDNDDYEELASGTGNYLYIDANLNNEFGYASVARNCSDGIDLTSPYTLDFLYRIEEDTMATHFTGSKDRYQLFDYPTIRGGSTGGCGWLIGAYGDYTINTAGDASGYWIFHDGQGRTGSTGSTAISSGIAAVVGDTYHFEIAVDPVAKSWDATITNLATSATATATDLGWRIDTVADPTATLSGMMQFAGHGDSGSDQRQFSVDSINIAQIPEPTAIAMLLGAFMMGLARRRRR